MILNEDKIKKIQMVLDTKEVFFNLFKILELFGSSAIRRCQKDNFSTYPGGFNFANMVELGSIDLISTTWHVKSA